MDLPRREAIDDPTRVAVAVQDAHHTYGKLLDSLEEPVLLMDPMCLECPIVGCSPGVSRMTGYQKEELLGESCRVLLKGVPSSAMSKSAQKNFKDYCRQCRVVGLHKISEISEVQPACRKDGSLFVNLFLFGLCEVEDRVFLLGVQNNLGEGILARLSKAENIKVTEHVRDIFKLSREHLQAHAPVRQSELIDVSTPRPDFGFFSERLQSHCLLKNSGYTAVRREPCELGVNCLVFGDRPVRRLDERGSLCFEVRVDDVTSAFQGLPVLGFTRRKPDDSPKLYPAVARCCGQSVLVGASGEAFVRDGYEHFTVGFKTPPPEEVRVWAAQADLAPHQRRAPVTITSGDVLQCLYLPEGRIQMLHNGHLILDFDVERPLDAAADYYAVVDVCFSAASLTLLPSESAAAEYSSEVCELDHVIDSCFRRSRRQSTLDKRTLIPWQAAENCKFQLHRQDCSTEDSDRSTDVSTSADDSSVLGSMGVPTCSSLPSYIPESHITEIHGVVAQPLTARVAAEFGKVALNLAHMSVFPCGTALWHSVERVGVDENPERPLEQRVSGPGPRLRDPEHQNYYIKHSSHDSGEALAGIGSTSHVGSARCISAETPATNHSSVALSKRSARNKWPSVGVAVPCAVLAVLSVQVLVLGWRRRAKV